MFYRFRLLFLTLACLFPFTPLLTAGSSPPPITFRVHRQVDQNAERAIPVQLSNPPEMIYAHRSSEISEKDISYVHVYQGPEAPGAKIQLDIHGRLVLETLTNANKGQYLIIFIDGKPLAAEPITKKITDGVLAVDNLTPEMVAVFKKHFAKKAP
ncbi:MAG: hypothetical protein SFY92_05910 [Verrucomicrobiae bacterium]|nr:hypothetical protein [Verrucomicrobiae bacterium]